MQRESVTRCDDSGVITLTITNIRFYFRRTHHINPPVEVLSCPFIPMQEVTYVRLRSAAFVVC